MINTVSTGAYRVNGVWVRIDVTHSGKAVLTRCDTDTGKLRVLEGAERTRWLKALGMDEATP
jgi:hypothetical protein